MTKVDLVNLWNKTQYQEDAMFNKILEESMQKYFTEQYKIDVCDDVKSHQAHCYIAGFRDGIKTFIEQLD